MMVAMTTTRGGGRMLGSVTLRNICQRVLTPSSRAASMTSAETALMARRQDDHREAGLDPDEDHDEEQRCSTGAVLEEAVRLPTEP